MHLTLTPCNVIGMFCCILSAVSCGTENKKAMSLSEQTNYYFQMDAARQTQIRKALQGIKIGDTYKAIAEALGKPDHDQTLVTKDHKFRARVLTYYFKKWEKDLVNEKRDRLVRLELDASNHLDRIVSNVDGVPNRERGVQ